MCLLVWVYSSQIGTNHTLTLSKLNKFRITCLCSCGHHVYVWGGTHRDVGSEAGDERGGDGVGDGGVGTLGLLSCCSNNVKPNEGVEASGCTLHHLQPTKGKRYFSLNKEIKPAAIWSVCILECACECVPTPDQPKGRNLPSSQFSPLTKNSPATIMNTHTMRLMTFSTLLKPTEFFTPKATMTVTSNAISRANRSGYDCSPLPREEAHTSPNMQRDTKQCH